MGDFADKIRKRLEAAKANMSAIVSGRTMTGEEPNQIMVNPDIIMRTESVVKEAADPDLHRKHHVFFYGRVNPPTSGHEAAYNFVKKLAKKHNATSSMILSRTQDKKKNPLSPEQKEEHAKKAFPDVVTKVAEASHPTLLHQLSKLHENGITDLHMVAGSDRIPEYEHLINQYNGKAGPHGYYNFKSINLHSAGERDPDSEGVSGVSASSQRQHVMNGNEEGFAKGAPSTMKPEDVKKMYNDVREGMSSSKQTAKKLVRK
jgi:hypothetical protein